ncbi:uncharacterized protein LOC131017418 [Salvia miltiorrhiza]|uniref:uncharacterized protein LOC131017418 n=1 Tax=Salvia miltiorrhiza TaxID=226208 RepID=UPI0025ACADBC|nr:uncharacterized protein LOC131017418 [Salvia miltiorrhiza]
MRMRSGFTGKRAEGHFPTPPVKEIILQNKMNAAQAKATKWRQKMLHKAQIYLDYMARKAQREAAATAGISENIVNERPTEDVVDISNSITKDSTAATTGISENIVNERPTEDVVDISNSINKDSTAHDTKLKDASIDVEVEDSEDDDMPVVQRKRTRSATRALLKSSDAQEKGCFSKRGRYTKEEKGKSILDPGMVADTTKIEDVNIEDKKTKVNVPKNPVDIRCKRRGRRTNQPREADNVEGGKFPKLNTRTCVAALFDGLKLMNNPQKESVKKMGFGVILELSIREIPGRMAYWVLDHFNYESGELEISPEKKIKVTEDDVYRVFGVPRGNKEIELFERTETNDLFVEWVTFFGQRGKDSIKIGAVVEKMLDCTDGGTWFKRHFMIVVAFCMFESTTNGTVHPFILNCLVNLDKLWEWNWASYVMRSLSDHKKSWELDKSKMFVGPTAFIVLFYVDRVQVLNQPVCRALPLFKNWTTKMLRAREKREKAAKKFGTGPIRQPIPLPYDDVTPEHEGVSDRADVSSSNEGSWGMSIIKDAFEISEKIERLKKYVKETPESVFDDANAVKRLEEAEQILGLKLRVFSSGAGPTTPHVLLDDDAFYSDPPVLKSIDEAFEDAISKGSSRFRDVADIPSFDLGLPDANVENIPVGPIVTPSVDHAIAKNNNEQVTASTPPTTTTMPASAIKNNEQAQGIAPNFDVLEDAVRSTNINEGTKTLQERDGEGSRSVDKTTGGGQIRVQPVKVVGMSAGKENEGCSSLLPPVWKMKNTRTGAEKRMILGSLSTNIVGQLSMKPKIAKKGGFLKSANLRSPYLQREISTSKQLNKTEKELGIYGMYKADDEEEEVMFSYKDIELRRSDMYTLRRGAIVGDFLVSAWCVILNSNEQTRSNTSPARFFASVNIFLDTIFGKDFSVQANKDVFFDLMTAELTDYHNSPLKEIDLFFFPIKENDIFYAMCVDTRKGKIFVLDSTIDPNSARDTTNYEKLATVLRFALAEYLRHNSEFAKADAVSRTQLHLVKMKWADRKNTIDTGVYLMRHLETFMGDGSPSWKCGMSSSSPRLIGRLRVRYCARILDCEYNDAREGVLKGASEHYQTLCADTMFNAQFVLLG